MCHQYGNLIHAHNCDCNICSDLLANSRRVHNAAKKQNKINMKSTEHVHFSSLSLKLLTHFSYDRYCCQICFNICVIEYQHR